MGAWFAEQVMLKIRLSGESFRAEVGIPEEARPAMNDPVVLWAILGDLRSGNGHVIGTGVITEATPTAVVLSGRRIKERWGRRELTAAQLDALLPTGSPLRPLQEELVCAIGRAKLPTASSKDRNAKRAKPKGKSVWARPSGFTQ